MTYQWYFGGAYLTSTSNGMLILTNVQTSDAGNYYAIVTNSLGSVTSSVASLTVWTNFTVTPALLKYHDIESGSNVANINCRAGTVRFWFKPDWNSANTNGGSGPGTCGRLIEMGQQTNTSGWWSLYLSSDGTQLMFGSQSGDPFHVGLAQTNLTVPISWASNIWHQIVLTYTPSSSALYIDGAQVGTNGLGTIVSGINYFPNLAERANGFCIGSDCNGYNQAKGVFDELDTFNYPLASSDISSNYEADAALDSDLDGLPNIIENEIGTDPYNPDSNGDGIPDGWQYNHGQNPLAPVAPGAFQIYITRPSGLSSIP